ncbi:galactokinase [Micromonospora pattaloongensis]|uniref:Galactokinase n=1 Tax=Micromonospora pattaloongensis TaxID=405436 RepID=A0A1H3SZ81_9ACTN|nr:galactokinase [Micromonospora pattaloongensis]SDZ42815.1 galactokinase [Micromonospora pattaloongensis]
MSVADRAAALFTERYGTAPAGVWSAPGRVNLIGEHTDYNDGFVLPFAVPLRTAVAAAPAAGPGWTIHSREADETVVIGVDDLTPGRVTGWAGYVVGVLWALREAGVTPPPARIALTSDVPLGAGLSSSAALECAVLAALVELGSLDVPKDSWPRLAQRAENGYVGMPCGIMDQSASTLCRAGHALFLDCRDGAVEHVPFDLAAHGLALLVVDTNAPHRLVSGEYAARRAACESAARTLGVGALRDVEVDALPGALDRLDEITGRRVRHVVTENQRVLDAVRLLRDGRVTEIAPLLTASHASMRDDYEITVPEVDTAVDAMLAAGAHGARMTGGGFGGCVLGLVDRSAVDATAAAVRAAFAAAGYAAPHAFAAVADRGVARLI